MMRKSVLAAFASFGLVTSLGFSIAADQGNRSDRQSAAKTSSASSKERFVGTWKLVSTEQRNAKGEIVPPATGNQNRVGYLVYDPAGYMAVSIMPVGRKKYAGAQPTNEEAKAAITGYTAYFGRFSVNEAEGAVTHLLEGSLNAGMGREQKRFFELTPNRLTLKPPPGASGNQMRLTWERIPDLSNLTAEQLRFVGFWKLISSERRNEKGELVSSNPGQTGYVVYTRAGFMTVHMVQPDRKPYASAQPTPEEARQTIRTYTNYFGPFYTHETDGYVVHDEVGTLNIGRLGPSPQQRFYQFSGNRLMLKPPPMYTPDGLTIQSTITWERVDGAGTNR